MEEKNESVKAKKNGFTSAKYKLIAGITLLNILGLLGVSLIIFLNVAALNERDYNAHVRDKVQLIDTSMASFFNNVKNTVSTICALDLIRSENTGITSYVDKNDPSGTNPMLPYDGTQYQSDVYTMQKQFVTEMPVFLGISFGIEKNGGFIRYPEQDRQNGYDARARSWYKLAKANPNKVNFTDAYTTSAGDLVIVAARAVSTDSGLFKGVVTIDVDLQQLGYILDVVNARRAASIILADSHGTVLVHPDDDSMVFKNVKELGIKGLENYESGQEISFSESLDDGLSYQIFTISSKNGVVPLNYIVRIPRSEFTKSTYTIGIIVIISIVLAFICSFMLSTILSRVMTKPLNRITDILKNISEGDGDLTVRLPVQSRDEIGLLSGYFNETIEKIARSIASIIDQSETMQKIGDDLAANMTETASAVNEISANITSIKNQVLNQSSGVTETRSTIEQIVSNIEKLNRSIDSQASNVVESSSSIEEMVANNRSVTQILGKNSETVKELGEAAESGRGIVDRAVEMTDKIATDSEGLLEASTVIQNIASQTNLLAMNAAIEAAHAGDFGKGFAVVADEIRKLAEDSNSQGKKISSVLQNLKESISEVSGGARTIQKQFGVIFDLTQTVQNQEDVIKNAMQEQSSGGEQVLEAIRQINDITGEVKEGSDQMNRGSREILVEMGKLAEVTREISDRMNEMSTGTIQINNAMQDVNAITLRNSESIRVVAAEVSKFKVQE